jgi:anti-sigma factor RsiW
MRAHDEMTCRELVELVTDYLEGKLPAGDKRRLEAHLDECPYCMEYIDQMRQTIGSRAGRACSLSHAWNCRGSSANTYRPMCEC